MYPSHLNQSHILNTLSQVPSETMKDFVEKLLDFVGTIDVIKSRTGLVMLPFQDTAKGELFHLGEVLISEAQVILVDHDAQGYAACLGRDIEQALAIAVVDAALSAELQVESIESFVREHQTLQENAEMTLLKQVEATRVEMETF